MNVAFINWHTIIYIYKVFGNNNNNKIKSRMEFLNEYLIFI